VARPRNNIMKLSPAIRWRIFEFLEYGSKYTYDDIRNDPEVKAALEASGLEIHGTTFLAYREGDEYQEWHRLALERGSEISNTNAAAWFVQHSNASDDIARTANYELLRLVLRKLKAGDDIDPKELASMSRCLAGFDRNAISAKKEDTKREFAEKEAEYQAKIAELSAKITEMSETKSLDKGLSEETLQKIEEKIGLL